MKRIEPPSAPEATDYPSADKRAHVFGKTLAEVTARLHSLQDAVADVQEAAKTRWTAEQALRESELAAIEELNSSD